MLVGFVIVLDGPSPLVDGIVLVVIGAASSLLVFFGFFASDSVIAGVARLRRFVVCASVASWRSLKTEKIMI